MEIGYKTAIDMMMKSGIVQGEEYEYRIFFMTDAMPNRGITSPGSLLYMNKEASEQNKIYTTFFGVGLDFNTELIEQICKTRGCSYYTLNNESEFKKIINDDFDYMVFPKSFDIYLRIKKGKYMNIYGSSDTNVET